MKCWCGNEATWDGTTAECFDSKFHDPLATGEPAEISKIYVAGPMSGLPENNYPTFNFVADNLRNAGYTVVNPAEYGFGEGRVHYTDLLREDLRKLLDCHAVATLPNWWKSVGARNEVSVAGTLAMPIKPWREWLQ